MPKYMKPNGEIVDVTGYSENQLTYFLGSNPGAVNLDEKMNEARDEDFQKDPVSVEASAGSVKDTASKSDPSFLASQDRLQFTPPKTDNRSVYEVADDLKLKEESFDIFKKSLQNAPKTEFGTLDYGDEPQLEKIRGGMVDDFVKNNEIINKKIVPNIQAQLADELEEYKNEAIKLYGLDNKETITQENIDKFTDDVNDWYSKRFNIKFTSNPKVQDLVRRFNVNIDKNLAPDLARYNKSELFPNLLKFQDLSKTSPLVSENFANILLKAAKGFKSFETSAAEGATLRTIERLNDKQNAFDKRLKEAEENNWEPEKEGYWQIGDQESNSNWKFTPAVSSDGVRQFPPARSKKGTWGEFQNDFSEWSKGESDKLDKSRLDILDTQIKLSAFDENELEQLFEGDNIISNALAIGAEQLPQLALSFVTLGASSGMQIGGDIYSRGIDIEARKRFNIPEGEIPTIQQLREVFDDKDFMKTLEDKAVLGGFVGGQLDRLAAGKALKPFVVNGTKSILRSGYSNWLKNATNNLVARNEAGVIESITEVLQETLQAGMAGDDITAEELVEVAGTAYVSTIAIGMSGDIKNSTVAEIRAASSMIQGKLDPNSAEAYFNSQIKAIDTEISNEKDANVIEDLEAKRNAIIEVRDASVKIPKEFSAPAKEQSLELLIRKKEIENEIKGKDASLVETAREEINDINQQLKNIAQTERVTKKVLKAFDKSKLDEQMSIKVVEDKNYESEAKKNKTSVEENDTGFITLDGKTIVMNRSKAAELGEVNTAAHEFLHAILFKTLYNVDAKTGEVSGKNVVRGLAAALDEELQALEPTKAADNEIYQARLKLYKQDPNAIKAEEKLTLFADALFYGDIKYNENILTKIGDIVRRILQNAGLKKIKFNSGRDVYNFLKDYNRAIERGNLGKAITKAAKEGAEVSQNIRRFTGPENIQARKNRSISVAAQRSNARVDSITKDQLNSPQAQSILYDEIVKMATAQIANRYSLPPQTLKEFADDVAFRIYNANENTKWDGRGKLSGFLGGRISLRIEDVVAAEYKKPPQERLYLGTVENLQASDQKNLEQTETKKAIAEKPKYQNLVESKVLPSDAANAVKQKVVSTTRVLKSRIDKAVSLNRTVTPLIAEIKKEMGKQADIEFKKMLGAKRGGELRQNLLKLKKPILENMTTTWLMQAMPFAVQKQVDGKFTSDWQGKKIDRETVDTDKAGRTSGAEIVRRLPNIANRVSDDQFLGYMFKGDEVIRGRKEALAKAMAEEYAFDLYNQELQNPDSEIRKTLEANQERLGVEIADNFVEEFKRQTERGNVKFNRAGLGRLSRNKFNDWQNKKQDFYDGIQKMGNQYKLNAILQLHKNVYGDLFSIEEHKGIAKQFFDLLKPLQNIELEVALQEDGKTFEDYLNDIAIDIDGNASIASMTNAPASVTALFTNWNNVLESQAAIVNAIKNLNVQEAVAFLGPSFANSGRIGKWVDGKVDDSKTHRSDLIVGKQGVVDILNQAGFDIKEITNTEIIFNNGKIEKRKYTATGTVNKEHLGNNFDTKKEKENAKAAFNFTKEIVKSIKNESPSVQAMVLASLNSGTNTALRAAAPVLFRSSVLPSELTKEYRYEHIVPARVVLAFMYFSVVKDDKSIDLNALQKDYSVAIIPVTMDTVVGKSGLGQIMVAGYRPGEVSPFTRYYNILTRGKVQYALQSLENENNIIGQNYADYYMLYNSKKSKAAGRPAILDDPTTWDRYDMVDIITKKEFPKTDPKSPKYDPKLSRFGTLTPFQSLTPEEKLKVFKKTPGMEVTLEGIKEPKPKTSLLGFPSLRPAEVENNAPQIVKKNRAYDDAMRRAREMNYTINPKGISVWDFDDTLATTKSNVLYTMPNGTKGKLNAEEFAKIGDELAQQGAQFDFSEFSKVMKGAKGPMFEKAVARNKKFGNKNVYILTARPSDSKYAIHNFLKGIGLDIPLSNIVGLADGRPEAKADWIIGKVNEGYNDFYFADDAYKNVKAVQGVLDAVDVKSKVQQARAKKNKALSGELNAMIERNKGVRAETTYSQVKARKQGAWKGKFKFFLPYGAEDFRGLTSYVLAGKGKQGDADQKFFEDNLVRPYLQGISAMEVARRSMKNDYRGLLKAFPGVRRGLTKKIRGSDYTYDQAIRVYLWAKSGQEIPGISKRDQKQLVKIVKDNVDLLGFADGLLLLSKKEEWVQPGDYWMVGSILKDLNEIGEKVNRAEYLSEFNENVDIVFSDQNLNKLEALYGTRYVNALKNIIARMKSGRNRPSQPGAYEQKWLNWVNNSVGTIMFFNRRSALLQTLSFANFINWSDNNPIMAAAAFANQPAYWSAFSKIFNSPKLKERRGGLKSDVQEQEIANQAKTSKDKAGAVVAYLLKIGFTPTQIADSFAIAAGGATFLINRTRTYKKQGMSKKDAEAKAFEDFSAISDETQQSGDPMLISAQQASHMGRLILAFQNTPMQYTRLMKKAGQDIINNRGDFKTNFSKIAYYGFVQNLIFSTLQNALFALLPEFSDENEDEEKYKKLIDTKQERILNGMIDTILRGSGLSGAVVSTIKNVINKYYKEEKKGFMADHAYTLIEAANISPPIGSKLRKMYNAIQTKQFDEDVIRERGMDVTIDGKFNLSPSYQIIGSLSSGLFNLPLDRIVAEATAVGEMLDSRNTSYQRIALGLGYRTWDVNARNEEHDLIKAIATYNRKQESKEKAKAKRALAKEIERVRMENMPPEEKKKLLVERKRKKAEAAKKAAQTRRENRKK